MTRSSMTLPVAAVQNVEAVPAAPRSRGCLGLVSAWMPSGADLWDDWAPVRLEATPVRAMGELVIFARGGARFGVPLGLLAACADAAGTGRPGWIALPAWYARLLGLDDAVWM